MKRKLIVSLISIIFLISLSFQSSAFEPVINKQNLENILIKYNEFFRTIYVDDDALPGGDGTLEHPYQQIIDGVNAANPGDTVFVFNGIYCNNSSIDVRKSIKLLGEDKYNTIIDEPYSFKVNEVNGFEIRNFSFGWTTPNIMLNDCSHCIISEIVIPRTGTYGILLDNCSNCTVSYNNIQACSLGTCILDQCGEDNEIKNNYLYGGIGSGATGIECKSYNCIIANNTIDDFYGGIVLYYDCIAYITDNIINNSVMGIDILYSPEHIISRNKIINNYEGITLGSSNNVTISDNIIIDNAIYGISLSYSENIEISHNTIDNNPSGVVFSYVENSICSNNTITNSSDIGIDIMDSGSITCNNLISYNNVNNCFYGILLNQSWGNNYKNNIVNYNEFGIMIYGTAYFNVITKNKVGNNFVGVEIYGFIKDSKIHAPFDNWVVSNNIYENANCGIYATVLTNFNNIYYNNLIENYLNARDRGTNIWYKFELLGESMGNYWSDYEEKGGYDDDGDGIGDTPYNIPPWPFRNKDSYPVMDPIDIENTQSVSVNSYTISEIQQITQQYAIDNGIIFQNNFNYLNI